VPETMSGTTIGPKAMTIATMTTTERKELPGGNLLLRSFLGARLLTHERKSSVSVLRANKLQVRSAVSRHGELSDCDSTITLGTP
jgi:hypothetical protein